MRVPRTHAGRALAAAWAAACLGVLAFGWAKQHLQSMPEAVVLMMGFLSFPVSFAVAPAVGALQDLAKSALHIDYDRFMDILPIWAALSLAGYLQWFVLLPWLFRRGRRDAR